MNKQPRCPKCHGYLLSVTGICTGLWCPKRSDWMPDALSSVGICPSTTITCESCGFEGMHEDFFEQQPLDPPGPLERYAESWGKHD